MNKTDVRVQNINILKSEIIAAFIGIIVFVIIYGITPVNPRNDSWIMAGYDETDIIQHYAGWLAYRNSDWKFPIGLADKMAVGDGTMISYTDSIPWVAIFFKLFRNILPRTFQYFGLYTLFCYMLQGIASFKIIYYKTKDRWYSLLGVVLFCFSPILMERAFRHTALGSHWLILFSILLYLKHWEQKSKMTYVYFLLLEILAIGIHPYFLPMIACFSLLCALKDVHRHEMWSVIWFILQLAITYLTGCVIGVLGSGVEASREGFGHYSMNMNAVMNPTSCGGYTWSAFLKVNPQILGNYDGFNYLGVGILVLIISAIVLSIVFATWKEVIVLMKKYLLLCIILCFLTAFAVSNVVTYHDRILLTIPMPDVLLELCGIFRASSRMFYPVYYLIFLFLVLRIWRYREFIRRKGVFYLLLFAVVIQVIDIHHVIIQKHENMVLKSDYDSILQSKVLEEVAGHSGYLILENYEGSWKMVAAWALKNGMGTYYSVANSGNYDNSSKLEEKIREMINESGDLGDYVIATTDIATFERYEMFPQAEAYEYEGIYFIYKEKKE